MEQYTFTSDELVVFSAISINEGATVYELTTATRLTPSEVLDAARALNQRNLVRLVADRRVVELTKEGQHLRLLMEHQRRQPFSSSSSAPIVVISDEDTGKNAARKMVEKLNPQELDFALETELQRLEQEAGQT
jgi:hypothetical protein